MHQLSCPPADRSPNVPHRSVASGTPTMTLRMIPRLRATVLAGLLVAPGMAVAAGPQDYPSQTIKIVVPFTPGGGVDVVARIIAPKLGGLLGQSVIIENRGGAGGMLGALAVAQA